jgi:hypothetical protein
MRTRSLGRLFGVGPRLHSGHRRRGYLSTPTLPEKVETTVCLVAPKSSQKVGFVARAMANFGVDRLIISAYDGSEIPPVAAGGPEPPSRM